MSLGPIPAVERLDAERNETALIALRSADFFGNWGAHYMLARRRGLTCTVPCPDGYPTAPASGRSTEDATCFYSVINVCTQAGFLRAWERQPARLVFSHDVCGTQNGPLQRYCNRLRRQPNEFIVDNLSGAQARQPGIFLFFGVGVDFSPRGRVTHIMMSLGGGKAAGSNNGVLEADALPWQNYDLTQRIVRITDDERTLWRPIKESGAFTLYHVPLDFIRLMGRIAALQAIEALAQSLPS
ncbi:MULTISPECIES: hypothetical protein [Roseomonadaceae]|uniref:Uncharacterized protein n=1 Tax=Falsiroseomonas oleicola TaxID=2801474 RepID=A0ABS6H8I3_9PROT|nr:hypothetical protein [Roseomonas oleicola]MBU8545017.1 hypothetical protein [Roseomonas oleicola]